MFNDMYGVAIEEGDKVLVAFIKYRSEAELREGTVIEIVPDHTPHGIKIKEVIFKWKNGGQTRLSSLHANRFYVMEKHG